MDFKIYECDFGVTVEGLNYAFNEPDSYNVDDPENTRLVRGAGAPDSIGIPYREGVGEPKVVTLVVKGMSLELFNLLKTCHKNTTRLDQYCISRVDGSSKIAKNAVLAQPPRQSQLDGTPESVNVSLVFHSFNVEEIKKT